MKRLLIFLLSLLLLPSFILAVPAASAEAFAVSEALTADQLRTVCDNFGLTAELEDALVLSPEEEELCFADSTAVLPEKENRLYCVYARALSRGSGLEARVSNLNNLSAELLTALLLTAGVTDAEIYVGAPYSVSGAAVPAEIFAACEAIGQPVSEAAQKAAAREFTLARSLMTGSDTYSVLLLLNDCKQTAGKTAALSDEELRDSLTQAAEKRQVSLTEGRLEELLALCRLYEKLDTSALKSAARTYEKTLNDLNTQENGGALTRRINRLLSSLAESCETFLDDLINKVL